MVLNIEVTFECLVGYVLLKILCMTQDTQLQTKLVPDP